MQTKKEMKSLRLWTKNLQRFERDWYCIRKYLTQKLKLSDKGRPPMLNVYERGREGGREMLCEK